MQGNNNTYQRSINCNLASSLSQNEKSLSPEYLSYETNEHSDAFVSLKSIRLTNKNELVLGYLNINSLRKKFIRLKSDNLIVVGDFNAEESYIPDFMNPYGMANLVKVPTCFFKAVNARCIDLILTNNVQCFKDTKLLKPDYPISIPLL